MFIGKAQTGYDRDGQQTAHGYFMIWGQDHDHTPQNHTTGQVWATVRQVCMKPLGNFMCGKAQIGKYYIPLSGTLGGDGLPCHWWSDRFGNPDLMQVWLKRYFERVPQAILDVWSKDQGHNTLNDSTGLIRAYGEDLARRVYNKTDRPVMFYGPQHPVPKTGPLSPIPKGDFVWPTTTSQTA